VSALRVCGWGGGGGGGGGFWVFGGGLGGGGWGGWRAGGGAGLCGGVGGACGLPKTNQNDGVLADNLFRPFPTFRKVGSIVEVKVYVF